MLAFVLTVCVNFAPWLYHLITLNLDLFLKIITYLFFERERENMSRRGRGRKKLKQTMLSMDPLRGSISQPWDRDLSWNQESDTNWLHHPGAHELEFFVYKWRKQCLSHRNFLRTNYMKASCKVYASVIWGVCGLKSWLGKEVKSLSNRKWSHH